MKKYEVGAGILGCCLDFSSLVVEAENKVEALKKFFNVIIEDIKNLDYEDIVQTDDGWINEEK